MKKLLIAMMAVLLVSSVSMAAEDVTLPNSLKAGDSQLLLNGSGIREKFFMDLYVGGLYLNNKKSDPSAIIAADEPMGIKLHIVSGMITSDKMTAATNEGFVNATNGNTAPIQSQIDQFLSVFKDEISVDDVYDMVYTPGIGTEVYKAGKKVQTIKGMEFKKALFGIWLCDKPAQDSLKEKMLGL